MNNKRTQRAQTSLTDADHYPNIARISDLECLYEGMLIRLTGNPG